MRRFPLELFTDNLQVLYRNDAFCWINEINYFFPILLDHLLTKEFVKLYADAVRHCNRISIASDSIVANIIRLLTALFLEILLCNVVLIAILSIQHQNRVIRVFKIKTVYNIKTV